MKSAGAIVVFVKAPRAGLVKTRMSPPLSPDEAAELYSHMLDDVLAATADVARSLNLDPIVTVHPADACYEIASYCPPDFRVIAQRGHDLGERMAWATAEAAATGARRILLRGSDSPTLAGDTVRALLGDLEEVDVAICPDFDGGYSLIGMKLPIRGLFDHAMSTHSVLEDTQANARALGLTTKLLPPSFDIDTTEDLVHLAKAREEGQATTCPRTVAYLDDRNLWP